MKLRKYQTALNKPTLKFLKAKKGQRGQVYAPTGSGKTVCFNQLIEDAIKRGKMKIAILHPRIALSQDQQRRFKQELGSVVHTTSFHSGEAYKAEHEIIREVSTLSKTVLLDIIHKANTLLNKPHITFTTYHSFHQLVDVHFDIVICDEAHYMVQDAFYGWIQKITADKILFYTATPINGEMEDGLMNAPAIFGNIIAQVEPTVLIKGGYILAPLIHQMECVTGPGDEVDIVDVVARAYVEQWLEVTAKGLPVHQMLVAARGVTTDLREIENRLVELWKKISDLSFGQITQVDIYTIEAAGAYKNGVPCKNRNEAVEMVKSGGKNAIIAHYDTISEGIDIDTLSGALLMRKMSKAKLIQTIGRCARPFIGDLHPKTKEPLKALFDFEAGVDNRKKPRCVITLPVVNGKWIANDDGTSIARAFSAAGYDELFTYLHKTESTPTGKHTDNYIVAEDDTFMSAIQSHRIEKQLVEMKALFGFK